MERAILAQMKKYFLNSGIPPFTSLLAMMVWSVTAHADSVTFTKPLDELTAIRERPLFAPSRRPVAAPVVSEVPDESPRAAPLNAVLVGLISSSDGDGLALLKINGQNDVARLRIGEIIEGWQLEKIESHGAMFVNGDQTTTLTFPESTTTTAESASDGSEALPEAPSPKPLLPQGIVNPQ